MGRSCVAGAVDLAEGPIEDWLRRLREAHARGALGGVEPLAAELARLHDVAGWADRARFDPTVPYGRTVLLAEEGLEVMIAGWSRDRPCAPHDHGPGLGAVRVLAGRACHRRLWLDGGALRPDADERLGPGAVLRCPPGVIHQMQDDGADAALVTLHAYVGPTTPMTVYDLEHGRTQWLDGGCGAWPRPTDDPRVLAWAPGLRLTPC